jgi:uncharacterized protein YjbK
MPAEPRELELKYRIDSESDYLSIVDGCPAVPGREDSRLRNYYFDTHSYLLSRSQGMLRLREGGAVVLCFKKGGEKEGVPGFFDVIEVEGEVSKELLEEALRRPGALLGEPHPAIRSVLKHYGQIELASIGYLDTLRRYRQFEGNLLECDEVTYADGSRAFEVEVETTRPENTREALLRIFEELGIAASPQRHSKLQGLLRKNGILP